jgi:hypothetical protein
LRNRGYLAPRNSIFPDAAGGLGYAYARSPARDQVVVAVVRNLGSVDATNVGVTVQGSKVG